MKLCTVCGVLTGRTGSRCTEHMRQSNRSRHNALYSTRAWQRLSARDWCPGYQRPTHPAALGSTLRAVVLSPALCAFI